MAGCHVQPEQMFNLIFGYNAQYAEYVSTITGAAPDRWVYLSEVPVGEVWVVTNISASDVTAAPSSIQLYVYDGAGYFSLAEDTSPVRAAMTVAQGWFVMKFGDRIAIRYRGVVAGHSTYGTALGFKMKLTQ